ncbi:MAG TPA: alcohol dehydrogenase catalytic domain-containing protein [Phycisphaerae bacterium]|jgi:L-iditol 2-dehydrogenase|nr:alcohol dehydrogenase catalytic domain-containing protein [Phycisphaerae bacterium]HOB73189.1 alcohol dehydrogenase catalytic domain-containing protein [Phycisphaerae bacterium]HOJ55102.1 alcohol dehydrogenase catalytic domain-containing protein [Phycisphaerae bacterium]HOL27932.1 alcohol dehydrogenase catalytic domain-containing protein [Phycisphaerae bacterium]HPP21725.1 alcohol dehydrogenase catalytic domain-containing protein [Phycisphaerae bacterium]
MMNALVYDIGPARWLATKAAGWFTPAAYYSRISAISLRQVPIPALPSPEWLRLRPILGGICGTDLAAITLRHHPAGILQVFSSMPAVLGHENVSIVDEVGPAVTRWRPGDRVVVEPSLSCLPRGIHPPCPQCTAGRFTLCDNFLAGPLPPGSMIGWNSFTGGSWAPYFIAHQSQLYAVPEEMNDEEAVLTDPIAGALHAVLRHPPADDQTVLILGAGLLGLGIAAGIRALGGRCRLIALTRHPRQSEMMQRFGVNETIPVRRKDSKAVRYGRVAERIGGKLYPSRFGNRVLIGGFDVVYDCIGTGESLSDAMKYARSGGTVVEVGTSQISMVDTTPLWFNEVNLVGANGRAFEQYDGRRMHTYEIVFELVKQNRLDLAGLLTHRFQPADYRRAFAALVDRAHSGAIKVAFEPAVRPRSSSLPVGQQSEAQACSHSR